MRAPNITKVGLKITDKNRESLFKFLCLLPKWELVALCDLNDVPVSKRRSKEFAAATLIQFHKNFDVTIGFFNK